MAKPAFASGVPDVRGDYIDFISSYCDRWCERCAFTTRCSSYAVQVAIAMCEGDVEAGLELAVAAPPARDEAERRQREAFLESLDQAEPTREDLAEVERELRERDERVEESPIVSRSWRASLLAHTWLTDHREPAAGTDAILADAIEVASRDCFPIHVKLRRPLNGHDRAAMNGDEDDDPIQNDWNGSAKVALVSIAGSTKAWTVIAQATTTQMPCVWRKSSKGSGAVACRAAIFFRTGKNPRPEVLTVV